MENAQTISETEVPKEKGIFGLDLVKLFEKAFHNADGKATLVGNTLIVQKIPVREVKTSGGIIMSTGDVRQVTAFNSNQPEFVKVLAVGAGYYDEETGKEIPVDVKPGEIIQIGRSSVNWFTSFGSILFNDKTGRGIGFTVESETKMKFKDEASFEAFMDLFYKLEG